MTAGSTWINPLGKVKITVNSTSSAGAQITVATAQVPNIVGLTRAGAANALSAAGLTLATNAIWSSPTATAA